MDISTRTLTDHQQIKKNPWRGYVAQGETESLIIAAQDQTLNMLCHQRNIMKQPLNCKCRMHNTCAIHTLIDTIRWLVTSTG